MKTYEFTLKHDNGTVTIGRQADTLEQAKRAVLDAEKAPESAIVTWRVVPTAKQVRRTQSLLRGL